MDFFTGNLSDRLHLIKLFQTPIQLFFQCFFPFAEFESRPLLSRRALGLEGCGVFFCRPQVVHGLFCMGEILVLQSALFGLGQALCLQGGAVVRVDGQHFLRPADESIQHLPHLLHHLVDGAALACVLLCLPALERHPALEALLAVKDAPPCVGHQLLRCLLIGQALGAVIPQFRPDHLVQAFVATALRQIFQRVLLQSPCALGVQRVVPVVVLVQHRAKNVLRTVPKEDAGRLGVHIGPDAPVVLQHIPQHSIRAGGRCVQADDLAGRVALLPHRTLGVYLAPAAGALAAKRAAQFGHLFGIQHPFSLALGVGDLEGRPPGVGAQDVVDVRRRAAHAARQLQRLRKGGSAAPAQPVQRRRCGRIPVSVHPVRHIFADGLGCLVRHPPAFQRPLHLGLPLGLRRFRPESQSLPQRGVLVAVGFSCGGKRFTHVVRRSRFRHDIGGFCGSILYCLRHTRSFAGQLCALCSRRCFALYVLLCGDLPQHPAGRARSVGQRHAVSLLKGRTVFPVLGVRCKQPDGLARQIVARRHFGKLPHRRVFRFCGSCFRPLHTFSGAPFSRGVSRRER